LVFEMVTSLLITFTALSAIYAIDVPIRHAKSMELQMPMRDGVSLHTLIFFPHAEQKNPSGKYPAVVDRSPYGYGDLEWIVDIFLPLGFVSIGQDMRGTEKSGGNFSLWVSDANDSQDLGDWIVKQDWSNGEVYSFGASADGMGSFQTIKNNPSWLAAQYIAWAPAAMYKILVPYGTYKEKTAEDWLHGLTMPNPSVVDDNIKLVRENEMHSPFWESVELSPADYQNMHGRSGFWGGWYDLFVTGTIEAYEGYNTMSDESVRYTSVITIDPLGHCQDVAYMFPQNTVMGRTALVFGQLFQVFGVKASERMLVRNITFFVMSSNDEVGLAAGQYWTSLENWPKPKMTDYYLHADQTASTEIPKPSEETSTSYKYDPANPAPTMGGNNLPDSIGGTIPCGPLDQAEVDARSDVLTFTTAVMEEELALTGTILATLYVSSNAKDTDFTAKVSDVYPTGEVRILQDNAIRMRWREGGLEPVAMKRGEVYKVEFDLWNTSYVVAPGHALRFSISSSNYPRFSVNPNNGLLLSDENYPGEFIVATNTLYHSSRYASKISLPVVHKRLLPNIDVVKEVQKAYPSLTNDVLVKLSKHVDDNLLQMIGSKAKKM